MRRLHEWWRLVWCEHRFATVLDEGIGRQGALVRCDQCGAEFREFVEGD